MKFVPNPNQSSRFRSSRRRGAAILEFALVSSLFLLLLLGIVQFGIYLNATSAVVSLSRESARYAATLSGATQAQVQTYTTAAPIMPPQLRANRLTSGNGNISLNYYNLDGSSSNTRVVNGQVRVTLTYDMRDKIFLGSAFTGAVFGPTYTSAATFRVEQ